MAVLHRFYCISGFSSVRVNINDYLLQSVQRRKDDMARNLDESRRMIMAVSILYT